MSERGPIRAAGSVTGDRRSARDLAADDSIPPWRYWRVKDRASRCIRWIETYVRIPSGANAGKLLKLAPFQRDVIETLLAPGVRTGGLQIPRGNAKSTLCAAIGLWAVMDYPDMPQVPLIAYNSRQAYRNLFRPLERMLAIASPEVRDRAVPYSAERRIVSVWNAGELLPLPADVERLQGLNPTIALMDEAQTVDPEIFAAVLQGAGKRPESLVLAIGTPAPGAQSSALYDLREKARGDAPIAWIEYAAAAECDLTDRYEWRRANPALEAGILYADVLETELAGTVDEIAFRSYRLGQWLDVAISSWLPPGAWAENPVCEVPPDGTEIVLALAGSWRSSVALVGATLDGETFLAWADDRADDETLHSVIDAAVLRWNVREVVIAPRIRPTLVRSLAEIGYPVFVWPATRNDYDASASTEWRRAIVDGRLPHDHDELIATHVGNLNGRAMGDGTLRLEASDDSDVDAARAARMAWVRAREASEVPAPMIY